MQADVKFMSERLQQADLTGVARAAGGCSAGAIARGIVSSAGSNPVSTLLRSVAARRAALPVGALVVPATHKNDSFSSVALS